jgi:hypothetical protein
MDCFVAPIAGAELAMTTLLIQRGRFRGDERIPSKRKLL